MRAPTKIQRTGKWAVRSLALGGLILVGLGLYFIFIRPPLLPEDPRYMGTTLEVLRSQAPGLLLWLPQVFTVMGGYMTATGILACYLSFTGFKDRAPGARLAVALAGGTSIGLMAYVNFVINSDFKWLLLSFTIPWLLALLLYAMEREDADV